MKEYFVRLSVASDGRVMELGSYTRNELVTELMRPSRVRGGAFAIDPEDVGDVLLLKRAVEAVGGIRQLCFDLRVSRETLYNWKNRGYIPSGPRAAVKALVEKARAEGLIDDEGGDWEEDE